MDKKLKDVEKLADVEEAGTKVVSNCFSITAIVDGLTESVFYQYNGALTDDIKKAKIKSNSFTGATYFIDDRQVKHELNKFIR